MGNASSTPGLFPKAPPETPAGEAEAAGARRSDLESAAEHRRLNTPICAPYVQLAAPPVQAIAPVVAPLPAAAAFAPRYFNFFLAILYASSTFLWVLCKSGWLKLSRPKLFATPRETADRVVSEEANEYVRAADRVSVPRCDELRKSFVHAFSCSQPSLHDLFSPKGRLASSFNSRSERRVHLQTQSDLCDSIIRAHTVCHNGAVTSHPLLPSNDGTVKAAAITADSKTRFQTAARNYKIPTESEILSKMPDSDKTSNTHPYLAAARHLTISGLRRLAKTLDALQHDPCISSSQRDKGAFGERPFHQLKDLGHSATPQPTDIPCGTKVIDTLIDCLAYETSLAAHSGRDMIIWASLYSDLAGETCESVYYADSPNTFVEIIGKEKVTAIYKNQIAWDFTSSDVVYVENLDKSAFTVYNVLRYPQPDLLKQVVFMAATQTVNLPYALVNKMTKWTKGHDLGSTGIRTPGPCKNVTLVPRDPKRPHTKDVLIMSNGTPGVPTVSIKYMDAPGPKSSTTMHVDVYNYLKYLNAHGGRGLTANEVVKRLELFAIEQEQLDVPGAAAYCELLRTVAYWGDLPNVVYYGSKAPKPGSHWALKEKEAPEESPTAKAVMAAPKITLNNPGTLAKDAGGMEAYKQEKLIGMKNDTVPTEEWSKISDVVLTRFIESVARDSGMKKGSVQLIDINDVRDARTRRVQKERQVTDGMGPSKEELGRVENKIEAGHKVGACPRGVQNPEHRISEESGQLGKTLELVLKKCGFYNPGSSPSELGQAVEDCYNTSSKHELYYQGGGLRSVDYTGADESHCEHSNRINIKLIEYFFADSCKAEALRIYNSCFNMPLQVGPKVLSSGWKNASGTGITTVLNTTVFAERELETAMVALVFRSMEDSGELVAGEYIRSLDDANGESEARPFPNLLHRTFLKHLRKIQDKWDLNKILGPAGKKLYAIDVVYAWIGPKFGDDGLDPGTPYVSDRLYECAMRYVDRQDGFTRKLETSSALKEEPVEYLSRIYPCPLRTRSSFCKVEKAVDKISIAVNRDRDRYILKLRGYWMADRNTPIVGAYLTATAKMYGVDLVNQMTEAQLEELFEHDRDLYYKVSNGPFPWDEGAQEEQYSIVAADYGMSSGELIDFDAVLSSQSTWSGIQSCMLPAKLVSETQEDPLGMLSKADPPGIARVPAWSTSTRGEDPRMQDFKDMPAAQDVSNWFASLGSSQPSSSVESTDATPAETVWTPGMLHSIAFPLELGAVEEEHDPSSSGP